MQISIMRLSHFLLLKLNPFIKVPPGVKMPGKKGGLIKDIELCRFYGTSLNRSYFPMKHSSLLLKVQIIKKRTCKAVFWSLFLVQGDYCFVLGVLVNCLWKM